MPEFGPGGNPKTVSIPILILKSFKSFFASNSLPSIAIDSGLGLSENRALYAVTFGIPDEMALRHTPRI